MSLTTEQAKAVKAINTRTQRAAAELGGQKIRGPRSGVVPHRKRGPSMRFVIETPRAADLASVRRVVGRILGSDGNLPAGVSWANRRLTAPSALRAGLTAGAAFDVRFLFRGADPTDQRFKLANFVVLTIPVDPLSVKRLFHGGTGALYALPYTIRDAGKYVRVDPEVPSKGWRTVRTPEPPPRPNLPGQPPTSPSGTLGPPHLVAMSSSSSSPGGGDVPTTNDHAWNLRAIHMPAKNNGGKGIRVGQVDTGTHEHPELEGVYVPVNERGCTIDGETDSADPLPNPGIDQPGHGTATASVLASRGGFTDFDDSQPDNIGTTDPSGGTDGPNEAVTGVANQVTVVPVRSVRSVFANVSNVDLAEGVWFCIRSNVDVITISVGGLCHPWLERVISFAVFQNIIVCAAAGQVFPFVTAPAVYDDCIAATATTLNDAVWADTAKGPAIDIAAPGAGIWCADVQEGENKVVTSNGTSFAAPTIAGAAALWLRHHGRQTLLQQYQNDRKLAEVYRHVIQTTAHVPLGWDTSESGAGIVNVTNLLDGALPAADQVACRNWSTYDATSEEQILRSQLGDPQHNYYVAALAKWFDTTAAEVGARLSEYGTEIMNLLDQVPGAFEDFKAAVEAEAQSATDAAHDAVDDVVDAVSDFCSDVVGTVMGWFD